MPEKDTQEGRRSTRTGSIARPDFPPEVRHDPPPPHSLPEMQDASATTGIMRVVTEGEDRDAERDEDKNKNR